MSDSSSILTRERFEQLPEKAQEAFKILQDWWFDNFDSHFKKLGEKEAKALELLEKTDLPDSKGVKCSTLMVVSLVMNKVSEAA